MESIFHRTSIRKYTEQEVEQEKINEILKAAMAAPSAGNQQPWEYYVVRSQETLQRLAAASPHAGCAAKAPMAFVVCCRNTCRFPEYAQIDAVRVVLDIPEELEAFAIIPCGYPAEEKIQQERFEEIRVHYVD